MTVRTVQLIGLSYATQGGITLEVTYNNIKVFNDTIPIMYSQALPKHADHPRDGIPLAEWHLPELATGHIPLSIFVKSDIPTSGIKFSELRMNYTNNQLVSVFDREGNAVNDHEPFSRDFFATPQIDIQLRQFIEDKWGGDGKTDCQLNGKILRNRPEDITQWRHRFTGVLRGSWHYNIPSNSVFDCRYHVDKLQFVSVDQHQTYIQSIRTDRGPRSWAERNFDVSGPPLWIERKWPQIRTDNNCDFVNYTYLPLTS